MELDKPPLRLYDDPTNRLDPIDSLPRPSTPSSPIRRRSRQSSTLLDELLPIPASSSASSDPYNHLLRRTGSLAIISIFLISVVFLALSGDRPDGGSAWRLKHLFGEGNLDDAGGAGWVADDVSMTSGEKELGLKPEVDFQRYTMMRTLAGDEVDVQSRRVVFIGDIHGSFDALM